MRDKFFVCDSCGCLDSTSSGTFSNHNSQILPKESRGKRLCCACAPVYDSNGRAMAGHGRWHGHFKRVTATVENLLRRGDEIAYAGRLATDLDLARRASALAPCWQCGSPQVSVARSKDYAAIVCLQCGFGQRNGTIAAVTAKWNDGVG